jgi:hypothetical protein
MRGPLQLSDVLGPLVLTFGFVAALWAFTAADPAPSGLAALALVCCLAGIPMTLWGWERADRRELDRRRVGSGVVLGRIGPNGSVGRRAA